MLFRPASSNRWLPTLVLGSALAFVVLVARRPETVTRAEFYAEDGRVFFLGTYFGDPGEVLLRTYNGYLHAVPRLVGMAERLVPMEVAPGLANMISLLVVALVAGYLASDRLAPLLPDRRARLVAAAGFVILPATQETLGSIAFIQAYLLVVLAAVAMADPPRSRGGRALEATAVALSALSTPVAIVLAPLHWLRLRRYGSSVLTTTVAVTAAGVAQLVVLVASGPGATAPTDIAQGIQAVVLRLVVEPVTGALWPRLAIVTGVPAWVGLIAAVLLGGLLVIAATSVDRRLALGLVAIAWVVGVLGIVRASDFSAGLLDPFIFQRYFVLAGWAAVVVIANGLFAESPAVRRAALVLAVVFVAGATADFRLPARPDLGWPARSVCIGGPAPCDVPVFPTDSFTIRWPGPAGAYDQGDWTR